MHFDKRDEHTTPELDAERYETRGWSRSFGELEWLLLVLVMLYYSVPGTFVQNELALVLTMLVFALLAVLFRCVDLFVETTRWMLTIETWVFVVFLGCVLWFTGGNDSPLINLFLLVIIFSGLTLGRRQTMLAVAVIVVMYVVMAYLTRGLLTFTLHNFSRLMVDLAPLVLVGYVTTMLSSESRAARWEIKRLATVDDLTKLLNMRAFNLMLDKELKKADRYSKVFSLLMMDADGFKQINDRFGHNAGDRLIQVLASRLQKVSRKSDVVARFAGDEFLMLLPETDHDTAEQVGDRIRAMIENTILEEGGEQFRVTLSVGVASYPRDGVDATELLRCVDKALYQSKHRGGNSVSVYESGLEANEAYAC